MEAESQSRQRMHTSHVLVHPTAAPCTYMVPLYPRENLQLCSGWSIVIATYSDSCLVLATGAAPWRRRSKGKLVAAFTQTKTPYYLPSAFSYYQCTVSCYSESRLSYYSYQMYIIQPLQCCQPLIHIFNTFLTAFRPSPALIQRLHFFLFFSSVAPTAATWPGS